MKGKHTLACLAETLIANMVVYQLYSVMEPNREIFLQLNPHPLLLLSVVMGLLYGNFLGMVSATISSFFYVKGYLVVHGEIWSIFAEFANYKYPLLFFWTAMISGYFRDNHLARVERLQREKQEMVGHYDQLRKSSQMTQKVHQELKRQILGSQESILQLYDIASRLETLDSEEVYTETMGIIAKFLKASQVSIYTYHAENGFLRLKIRTDSAGAEPRSLSVRELAGFQKVVNEKRSVKWSEVREEGFPLMSAPIVKGDQVLAVVNVGHMEFDAMSEYAFQLFALIVDWVNRALQRASFVDELRDPKFIAGTRLWHYPAFTQRVQAEERRKREFGLEFLLVTYRLQGMSVAQFDQLAGQVLRTVDVVGYDESRDLVYILLPATPEDQLPVIEHRLLNRFGEHLQRVIC